MSQLMVSPGVADLAFVDEIVSISVLDGAVAVRPMRRPDAVGTQVFTDVVNAATAAGSTVVLHRLEASPDATVAIAVPSSDSVGAEEPVVAESGGIGLLIVRSESSVWTIDVGSHRLVRSDRPVDRLLLATSAWTEFEAMWIAPRFVRALTMSGAYLSGRRELRQVPQTIGREDRPRTLPLALSQTA